MTELLKRAIAQIEKLSPEQQDAIAARFMAESKDEEQWEQMAAMVPQEIASR
jgi:hypothetical protein